MAYRHVFCIVEYLTDVFVVLITKIHSKIEIVVFNN